MFTKDEYLHSLERTYRTSGFRNAGRWFGLAYRNLRMSMLLSPERRDSVRDRRQALLDAWKEFASQFSKGGERRMKTTDWNKRMQEVLERTSQRDIRRMAAAGLPGTHEAVAAYSDRLLENKKKMEGITA